MQLPVFPDSHLLTNSAISAWRSCPRKFAIGYRLGIRGPVSEALQIGSAFHLACESIALHGKINESEIAAEFAPNAPNSERERFIAQMVAGETGTYEQIRFEIAVAMAMGWAQRWKSQQIIEIVAAEVPFDLPITNPSTGAVSRTYRMAGKIDAIGRLPDGNLCLVERKTTSESIEGDSDYWLRLMMDSQLSRYMIACKKLGYDVTHAVYDVVRKPAIRPKHVTKKDQESVNIGGRYYGARIQFPCPEEETPRMFRHRIIADMQDRPDNYFSRREVGRTDSSLDEYLAEQWATAQTIRRAELDTQRWGLAAWPRNTEACNAMYRCQFFDICRGMAGDLGQEIPMGYHQVQRLHQELPESISGVPQNGDTENSAEGAAATE